MMLWEWIACDGAVAARYPGSSIVRGLHTSRTAITSEKFDRVSLLVSSAAAHRLELILDAIYTGCCSKYRES